MNGVASVRLTNFFNIPDSSLVDISEVHVDKDLSKKERVMEFIRQIKNPYRYRCGKFIVDSCYTENGLSIEDRLQSIHENE